MGRLQEFFKPFKIIFGTSGTYVVKDELDYYEEKLEKLYRFSCQKMRSVSDTIISDPYPILTKCSRSTTQARVSDPHWFNADPDTDPDPAFFLIADPDSGSRIRIQGLMI